MRTIPHRELRNNSAKVLDEVRNGGIIEVTNHGEVVAIMIPPGSSRLDVLRRAGLVRPARNDSGFAGFRRVHVKESSTAVLDELRGE